MSRHKNYDQTKAGDVLWIGTKNFPVTFADKYGTTIVCTHFTTIQLQALDAEIEPKQKRVKFLTGDVSGGDLVNAFGAFGTSVTACLWVRKEDFDLAKKLLEEGLPE